MWRLIYILIFVPVTAFSQNYSFSNIPQELVAPAIVIVRDHQTTFVVHDIRSATKTVKKVITILNETAKNHAIEYIHYNKETKVKSAKATLYDKTGKLIRSLKKSDILDQSSVSGFSIYEDDRVKILKMSYPSYPFTIEFEYEVDINGLMFYPSLVPQYYSKVSVQNASLTITVPSSNDLRYVSNHVEDPIVKSHADLKTYTWSVKNVLAFKPEPYGPDLSEVVPSVRTAPNQFEMGGYKGSMNSWGDIGNWQNKLNTGLDQLPQETQKDIVRITEGLNEKEKIQAVYEYMQNRTRYVSIQLGIGGWQPFSAKYVDENGYGDCKALTNYTKSLLKVAGIESNYTLVRAGRNEANIDKEFPSRQFNHVILAVPQKIDTVWLECTSQTNPFGYAGYFTGDRDVLMVTNTGGVIAHTPIYSMEDNKQLSTGYVVLDKDGMADADFHTTYTGLQYENRDHQIANSNEERKEWLYKNLDLNDFDIQNIEYTEYKNEIPMIEEHVTIKLKNPVAFSGKRMFFKPNLFNRRESWPKELENRTQDVVATMNYQDIDSIHYTFPEGVHVEFVPEPVSIETEFGSFSAICTLDENGMWYVRTSKMKKGKYAPEKYQAFVDFLKQIAKSDNSKVVIKRST